MKLAPSILAAALLLPTLMAADKVLPYDSFGPQVIAHELIGMEWWQWDNHGDSEPREYPIKVVVYWNQTLEETRKKFPVDRTKEQDYRYVKYSAAIAGMEKAIRALEASELDTSKIRKALEAIRSAYSKAEGDDRKPSGD
jgi:hypothetical protein